MHIIQFLYTPRGSDKQIARGIHPTSILNSAVKTTQQNERLSSKNIPALHIQSIFLSHAKSQGKSLFAFSLTLDFTF